MSDIPQFPGVRRPLDDFGAVKTDLQTQLRVYEVDLSIDRSIAAGTQLDLNFPGNAFYIDKAPDVGNAYVLFQDDSLQRPLPRVYVEPGFIAKTAWTRLTIENTVQIGKMLRIFYGVDVNFIPGNSAGRVDVAVQPFVFASSFVSVTALGANTPETVFTPAANVNGAYLWDARFYSSNAAGIARCAYLAKTSAPVASTDGAPLVAVENLALIGANYACTGKLTTPAFIPAGRGLYFISAIAEVTTYRSALYTLI